MMEPEITVENITTSGERITQARVQFNARLRQWRYGLEPHDSFSHRSHSPQGDEIFVQSDAEDHAIAARTVDTNGITEYHYQNGELSLRTHTDEEVTEVPLSDQSDETIAHWREASRILIQSAHSREDAASDPSEA